MRCPNQHPGALALAFSIGIIIPLIFPDKFIAILISLIVIFLAYILINCCK